MGFLRLYPKKIIKQVKNDLLRIFKKYFQFSGREGNLEAIYYLLCKREDFDLPQDKFVSIFPISKVTLRERVKKVARLLKNDEFVNNISEIKKLIECNGIPKRIAAEAKEIHLPHHERLHALQREKTILEQKIAFNKSNVPRALYAEVIDFMEQNRFLPSSDFHLFFNHCLYVFLEDYFHSTITEGKNPPIELISLYFRITLDSSLLQKIQTLYQDQLNQDYQPLGSLTFYLKEYRILTTLYPSNVVEQFKELLIDLYINHPLSYVEYGLLSAILYLIYKRLGVNISKSAFARSYSIHPSLLRTRIKTYRSLLHNHRKRAIFIKIQKLLLHYPLPEIVAEAILKKKKYNLIRHRRKKYKIIKHRRKKCKKPSSQKQKPARKVSTPLERRLREINSTIKKIRTHNSRILQKRDKVQLKKELRKMKEVDLQLRIYLKKLEFEKIVDTLSTLSLPHLSESTDEWPSFQKLSLIYYKPFILALVDFVFRNKYLNTTLCTNLIRYVGSDDLEIREAIHDIIILTNPDFRGRGLNELLTSLDQKIKDSILRFIHDKSQNSPEVNSIKKILEQ